MGSCGWVALSRSPFRTFPFRIRGRGTARAGSGREGEPGDWRLRNGSYGDVGSAVLGREVAGTVVRLGPGVTGFAPGDEVFGGCPGVVDGWAEQALVTAGFAAH
jgi:hypothetical protein